MLLVKACQTTIVFNSLNFINIIKKIMVAIARKKFANEFIWKSNANSEFLNSIPRLVIV